jgi:hypothetical protein
MSSIRKSLKKQDIGEMSEKRVKGSLRHSVVGAMSQVRLNTQTVSCMSLEQKFLFCVRDCHSSWV